LRRAQPTRTLTPTGLWILQIRKQHPEHFKRTRCDKDGAASPALRVGMNLRCWKRKLVEE
jgi:hypothetical protein